MKMPLICLEVIKNRQTQCFPSVSSQQCAWPRADVGCFSAAARRSFMCLDSLSNPCRCFLRNTAAHVHVLQEPLVFWSWYLVVAHSFESTNPSQCFVDLLPLFQVFSSWWLIFLLLWFITVVSAFGECCWTSVFYMEALYHLQGNFPRWTCS